MIRLSNADARRLVRVLDQAAVLLREHAAEQSYRRDACRAVRERILADYHQRQHEHALAVADAVTEAGGGVLLRLDAAEPAA